MRHPLALVTLSLLACQHTASTEVVNGGDTAITSPSDVTDMGYARCPHDAIVGSFVIDLLESYTTIHGKVNDSVAPFHVLEDRGTVGACSLLHPRDLFCEPACEPGTTCDADHGCVPYPAALDVGRVAIQGLSGPVELDAIAPVLVYSFSGDLPHPAFHPGDEITLRASSEDISLVTFGVEPLILEQASMSLARDEPSTLSWVPPRVDPDARVRVRVDIANHGGVPARITCEVPDTGSLVIDPELVNALLDVGYSGFPSVRVTRVRSDAAPGPVDGCVELAAQSEVVLPVDIPGLTSCSSDADCVAPQTCQPDLTCG